MSDDCPYKFEVLGDREKMIAYLADHSSYGGWNHPYRRWSPLSWNVKFHRFDDSGKHGDYEVDPELDEAWTEHLLENSNFDYIVEDMQRTYHEGDYTTYPGDDYGHWKFCFAGRSGGHMLLEEWHIPRPLRDGKSDGYLFQVNFLKHFDRDNWSEWLEELDDTTLEDLYKAVCCMDQDFTSKKIDKAYAYQMNWHRHQWEEEFKETRDREELASKVEAGFEPCPAI